MKSIILSKEGCLKVKKKIYRLSEKDCQDLGKTYLPGEWVFFCDKKEKSNYLGFINIRAEKNCPIIHILKKINSEAVASATDELESLQEQQVACSYIEDAITVAINKRKFYPHLGDNYRVIYGEADSLPGLIVDKYEKYIFLQINTAGIDRYRNNVIEFFKANFSGSELIVYDDENERKLEGLPQYQERFDNKLENSKLKIEKIKLQENGIRIEVSADKIQKIGYYYDHRLNRHRFEKLINSINKDVKNFQWGLDLFSYVGSWGLHMLRANVKNVRFVDRGDFQKDIENNLEINNFSKRGEFVCLPCFDYLDKQLAEGIFYDVVVSDPPAFAKTMSNKDKALSGYNKLHEKILKILNKNSLMAICSCTSCVSFEDLDKTVIDSANKVDRKINLIDMGFAGPDHPISSLKDKSHYLKYLAYYVE
ncbi:MAG: class I SAM-dependent methyltransferase [Oligoflexia bacterium]|nr:class I SAM-dependent methyltransferase [Oligoflexia bacterium]